MMISVSAFLRVELVAAAVLALWVVARYPRLGPKSLRSAMAVTAVAVAVMQLASLGVGLMIRLPDGTYAALFGCALPSFFAAFLASAWLMRVLAGALGGSGGGPGQRVPAPSRR
jgi:hypothetical protein